jgi:hypothetical protein
LIPTATIVETMLNAPTQLLRRLQITSRSASPS